ncbi:MAG: 50S ribosomal protein L3 N(5)-glutamine methyltransferase [Casimicrobium sp.]
MKRLAFPASPPMELATVGDWWRFALSSLERANASFGQGTANAAEDASFLVLGALSLPLDQFDALKAYALSNEEKAHVFALLRRRCVEHVPTAYALGYTEQMGFRFAVDERVLIPRSYLGELIMDELSPWVNDAEESLAILDLCTGSGCLAVLAAHAFPNSTVGASDVSEDALAVAHINVDAYELEDAVDLRQGDLFAPWKNARFDIIVSNPPYVTDESMAELPHEFEKEPRLALAAGDDGCDVVARMLAEAAQYLNPKGMLFVDVGYNRELVEARFPKLAFNWLATEGAEDGVFMLTREDLLA